MKNLLHALLFLAATAAPWTATFGADVFPEDLEKEAGLLKEAAQIRREINLHNLYNGLNLGTDQMEKLLAVARRASDLVGECFGRSNGRAAKINEVYAEILECVRNGRRIPPGLEGMGGLMEMEERKIRKGFFESLAALEAEVWEILTPAQRDIFKGYDPCLIPPKNLKDPVRVGQADDHEAEMKILEAARSMREMGFAPECRKILSVYLSHLERLLGPMTPEKKEKELDRMIAVCRRARALTEVEFRLQADDLAASINLDVQKDDVKEKAQEFMEIVRKFQGGLVGPVAKHFLDPLAIPILEDRIARAPEFAAVRKDLEALEGARPPGEGCAMKPGAAPPRKKYSAGELARILGIEGRKKAEFLEVVDKAKRAHMELLQTPMADGRTPLSKVIEIQALPAHKQQGAMADFFSSLQDTVPGMEGSYLEYIVRIKTSLDTQFERLLTPVQYSKLHALVEDILDHIEPGDEIKTTAFEVAARLRLDPGKTEAFVVEVRKAKGLSWKLLSIPGPDGKSPVSVLLDMQRTAPAGRAEMMGAFLDSLSQVIPGRTTTYAEEVEKIKRATAGAMKGFLSKEEFSTLEGLGLDILDLEAD